MAVQARAQFLLNTPLLCSSNSNGGGSAMGLADNGGELPAELCGRTLLLQQQQQQQMATTTVCSSALVSQQIDEQRREVDQFLCLQNQRLRMALQQQMKHHLVSLMKTMESKATTLLRHKEEELARASKVAAELEERLRQSEEESQAWQRAAKENEAMALALSSALEQACDNAGLSSASPPAPCCNSSSDPPRGSEADARGRQGEAVAGRCRGCGTLDSRVLFLPCMHLCACDLCGALLAACPVCSCAKQGSVEVFFP